MVTAYIPKDISDLQWRNIVDEIKSDFQKLQRRVLYAALNEKLASVSIEYNVARQNGEILEYQSDRDELKQLLLKHTKSELGDD